jgi:hypothetical protein
VTTSVQHEEIFDDSDDCGGWENPPDDDHQTPIRDALRAEGLTLRPVGGGGSCLFKAASFVVHGTPDYGTEMRVQSVNCIRENDDFDFNTIFASAATPELSTIEKYCDHMATHVYEDQSVPMSDSLELKALEIVIQRPLLVLRMIDDCLAVVCGDLVETPSLDECGMEPVVLAYSGLHYDAVVSDSQSVLQVLSVLATKLRLRRSSAEGTETGVGTESQGGRYVFNVFISLIIGFIMFHV